MASEYFNEITEFCCSVTDFSPTTAAFDGVTPETHTFTGDVGANGALVFDNAVVLGDDLGGNTVSATATGVYPNLTVDLLWPAVGTYYITVTFNFNNGSPACVVKLDGTVEITA